MLAVAISISPGQRIYFPRNLTDVDRGTKLLLQSLGRFSGDLF